MTAMNMPQAVASAETPPAEPHNVKTPDVVYRAEGLVGRIHDIRNLLIGIDLIQQERITGFADHAGLPELLEACDQVASMQVIAVEAVEKTARLADDLVDALRPDATVRHLSDEWDAAVARWQAAKDEADDYYRTKGGGGMPMSPEVKDECNRLDAVASDLQTAVITMRAPHLPALRFKLDHLLESDGGSISPWNDTYVQETRRDIIRLLGEA